MTYIIWLPVLRIVTTLILLTVITPGGAVSCTWERTFHDNFNGPDLDRKKWNTKYPPGNHGELQQYVSDAFEIEDGILHIKAEKRTSEGREYTSGIITSVNSFSQQYGYFKLRAKVPKGQGFWSGFWLLPEKAHYPWEIDVFELMGDDPSTLYMTNHWKDPKEGHVQKTQDYRGADFSAEFHNFAIQWYPSEIVWLVDGIERHRTTRGVPQEPMFLLVNLAVGGDWPGNPDSSTRFPGEYQIDFIEAHQQVCKT